LSCQFFNAAQMIDLFYERTKLTGISGIYWIKET
jgi:hypothetical protein